MKTIATAAILMILTGSAWADEAEKNEANTNEPIVLSEAEMDGVTAGDAALLVMERSFSIHSSTSTSSTEFTTQSYAISETSVSGY